MRRFPADEDAKPSQLYDTYSIHYQRPNSFKNIKNLCKNSER